MRLHVLSLTCLLLTVGGTGPVAAQKPQNYPYGVPSEPWEESFGNHRAVLQIEKPAPIANLDFQWRRPDKDAGHRRFLIIHAATGDTIRNIRRIEVNDEHCRLQFGPVEQKGTYYFYYLPYQVQKGYGFYSGGYLPKENEPDIAEIPAAVRKQMEFVLISDVSQALDEALVK